MDNLESQIKSNIVKPTWVKPHWISMYTAISDVLCEAVLIKKYLHLYIIMLMKILREAGQHMMSKHRLILTIATKYFMLSLPWNFPGHDMHLDSLGSTETPFSLHNLIERK